MATRWGEKMAVVGENQMAVDTQHVAPLASVGLRTADPLTQRLRMNTQIAGDLGDRTTRLHRQPNTAIHQLF